MSDVGTSLRNPAMMDAGLVQARPLKGKRATAPERAVILSSDNHRLLRGNAIEPFGLA
jgi:hypothetical protein